MATKDQKEATRNALTLAGVYARVIKGDLELAAMRLRDLNSSGRPERAGATAWQRNRAKWLEDHFNDLVPLITRIDRLLRMCSSFSGWIEEETAKRYVGTFKGSEVRLEWEEARCRCFGDGMAVATWILTINGERRPVKWDMDRALWEEAQEYATEMLLKELD